MAHDQDGHRERIAATLGTFDVRLRALSRYGVDLSLPGPTLLAELRARRDEMRRRHEELEETQREADRQLLPELLALYIGGTEADQKFVRDLLAEHPSFRWGFGWGLGQAIADAEGARRALAALSMKNGGNDHRDQIVALDHLCAAMQRAGLPVAALLREAAAWSSDTARFPPAASTRALLLRYAERFG